LRENGPIIAKEKAVHCSGRRVPNVCWRLMPFPPLRGEFPPSNIPVSHRRWGDEHGLMSTSHDFAGCCAPSFGAAFVRTGGPCPLAWPRKP
jgi:hypothetical protein